MGKSGLSCSFGIFLFELFGGFSEIFGVILHFTIDIWAVHFLDHTARDAAIEIKPSDFCRLEITIDIL